MVWNLVNYTELCLIKLFDGVERCVVPTVHLPIIIDTKVKAEADTVTGGRFVFVNFVRFNLGFFVS